MSERDVRRRVKELMAEWDTMRFGLSERDAAEAWAESMARHEALDDTRDRNERAALLIPIAMPEEDH